MAQEQKVRSKELDEQITHDLVEINFCKDPKVLKNLCMRVFKHIDSDQSGEIDPREVKAFLIQQYQKEFEKTKHMFNYLKG